MAGAYVKEFEKWLQCSNTGKDKRSEAFEDGGSVEMDDSNDEYDNCLSKDITNYSGSSPTLHDDRRGNSLTPGSRQCFQDEPPILEPVGYGQTKISGNLVLSDGDSKGSEIFDGCIFENVSDKRKVEVRDNSKFFETEKCFHNKVEKSENIFDKFTLVSEGDDFPPPLIPSHEAHLTTVDAKDDDGPAEKSYATLQNLSPNFCAMEADSTSEMMKSDGNNHKDRQAKAPVSNDIGMECDSTCMLGVSPHVLSPGSNLESDNPNTPFSPDVNTDDNPSMSWNSFTSRETYTSLMPFSEQTHLDFKNNFLSADDMKSVGVYRHDSGEWDRECPKLEAVRDVEEFTDTVALSHNIGIDDPHEPPVLSVVPPPSHITSKMAARRKRHTIDSAESLSWKHKTYSKDLYGNKASNLASSSTPSQNLPMNDNKNGRKLSTSKKRCGTFSRNHSHSHPRKQRERSKTLSIVDLISFSSHLPKDLYDFVVYSSQLSTLQNRMHRLVSLLFPQLAPELNLMSPESTQFETLLKDLIFYLKELEDNSNTKDELSDSMSHSGDDMSTTDSIVNVAPLSEVSRVNDVASADTSAQILNKDSKMDLLSLQKGRQCGLVKNDDPCCSKDLGHHSQDSIPSNSSHFIKRTYNIDSNISVIPRFSQLNLNKDCERILKNQPSVLVHKNPSALHKYFCKLSCSTLQLLLPDLDVSLMKEFSESPQDLLHFIDSVISSNSQAE